MCFPKKKEHPKEKKKRKTKRPVANGEAPAAPGGGESGKENEEDLTVAEAPDQMPECDLEPFYKRKQYFTADQLL